MAQIVHCSVSAVLLTSGLPPPTLQYRTGVVSREPLVSGSVTASEFPSSFVRSAKFLRESKGRVFL